MATAIEVALLEGNVDAVREMVRFRGQLQDSKRESWEDRTEDIVESKWYLLAARSSNKLMLHNLIQLDQPARDGTSNIPWWDKNFVDEVSRIVRERPDARFARKNARLLIYPNREHR